MEQGAADTLRDLPAADRLELLVDAVADYAIYLIDTDGIVRTWNAGAERLSGYRAHEIIGQPYSLFFTPEDREMGLPGQILQRARLSARAEHEGWQIPQERQPVLGDRHRAAGQRSRWPRHRICQDHPRYQRAQGGPTRPL